MMRTPLLVRAIAERAGQLFPRREVVSVTRDRVERSSYGEVVHRARRLSSALRELGIGPGDRVATFGWNSRRHLELYLAVPSMGAVLHTLNLRLSPHDLAYIASHAEDRVVIVDECLVPLLMQFVAEVPSIRHVIVMRETDSPLNANGARDHLDYEALIAGESESYDFVHPDERSAAIVCYIAEAHGSGNLGYEPKHKTGWTSWLATLLFGAATTRAMGA